MPIEGTNEPRWLSEFLARRGLERPDGRPLYAYRCAEGEAAEAREFLPRLAARVGPDLSVAQSAVFCLFAAEWWRRNHAGGAWKWEGILDALGWRGSATHRLYPVVEDGLGFWKRHLLKTGGGRGFLVTLACEGGLPLKLLRQEQSSLRRYFHALLQDFQLYRRLGSAPAELAARAAHLLRASLRQEVVYELSGNLVNAVWELQREVSDSATPLADLDRRHPSWRDNLPVVVEDDTALALLNNLVEDAVRVATRRTQGFSLSRRLRRSGSTYILEAETRYPPGVEERELAQLMGAESDALPGRLHLYVDDGVDAPKMLALASRVPGAAGHPQFLLEAPPNIRNERVGTAASRGVTLIAVREGVELGRLDVTGGDELSDLPWVFVESSIADHVFDYIGQGSVRSRSPFIFVAALAPWIPQADDLGTCSEEGRLEADGRILYRVSGAVAFADPSGGRCRVVAGSEVDQVASYELRGPVLSVEGRGGTIFRGLPRLIERQPDGTPTQIPPAKIEWRPESVNADWRSLGAECMGVVRLRYSSDGVVRFRARALLAPPLASIQLTPNPDGRSGAIELSSFGPAEVGVAPIANVEVVRSNAAQSVRLTLAAKREPPGVVEVALRWSGGRALDLRVPFPVKAGRFHARDGRMLRDEQVVAVDHLGGLCARVVDVHEAPKYAVEGTLICRDVPSDVAALFGVSMPLKQSAGRGWELDLRTIQDSVRSSLAMSRDLDALFRLKVSGSAGIRPRSLFVRRFDADLVRDVDSGEVRLSEQEIGNFTGDELDRLRVEAIALWDPGRDGLTLQRCGVGRWDFAPMQRDPGPWLILGWDGGWARIRPILWSVAGDGDSNGGGGGTPSALRDAVRFGSEETRRVALDALIGELAAHADHADWAGVYAYFELFREVPKSTLQLFERLIENPQAAALALLSAGDERFDLVWNAMEELPFCWELVPVASWLRAAEALSTPFRGLAHAEAILTSVFAPFSSRAPRRIQGLRVVVELIQERILKRFGEEMTVIERADSAKGAAEIGRELTVCEQQVVSIHADDQWPVGTSLLDLKQCLGESPAWCESLWRRPPAECGFRGPVLNAPVLAALCSTLGIRLDPAQVHNIRACRAFDSQWFQQAFCLTLAMAVSRADPKKLS